MQQRIRLRFAMRIVLPAFLTAALYCIALFLIFLPALKDSILKQKRIMLRELTHSAWNILNKFEQDIQDGTLSKEAAQHEALEQMRALHYGIHDKEYFWINDLTPRMILHPLRKKLEGQDLTGYQDPDGRYVFREIVDVVKNPSGEGYVRYRWRYAPDSNRVVPKLSFVKVFKPWGWVVGTGIYLNDVEGEIAEARRNFLYVSAAILFILAVLLAFLLKSAYRGELLRNNALSALEHSEERYRTAVEAAGAYILMILDDGHLYANPRLLEQLGYSETDLDNRTLEELFVPEEGQESAATRCRAFLEGTEPVRILEASLRTATGTAVPVAMTLSRIDDERVDGCVAVIQDMTSRREIDRAHQELAKEMRNAINHEEHKLQAELDAQIRTAKDTAALRHVRLKLWEMARLLYATGYDPLELTGLLSRYGDAILQRALALALAKREAPPAPFCILVLGSVARGEQTLSTDQDNALAFDSTGLGSKALEEARAWFVDLGTELCDSLDAIGYRRCAGEIMAIKWVYSHLEWREQFSRWIGRPEADALLRSKIFFDFRAGEGDASLAQTLWKQLLDLLKNNHRFFSLLARNMLLYEPPLSMLGSFTLEETRKGQPAFDIKGVMAQVVDAARLYALREGITAPNTLERLDKLQANEAISSDSYNDLVYTYRYLMGVRLMQQIDSIDPGHETDNLVVPSELAPLQQRILKESFATIKYLQSRVSRDFSAQG